MSQPGVNPWPGTAFQGPGPNARQFLRSLWIAVSAYEGGIAPSDTVTVYDIVYTCVEVNTGKFGQITLTDPSGIAWSVPNYQCPLVVPSTGFTAPVVGEAIVTNYNAAENTGS